MTIFEGMVLVTWAFALVWGVPVALLAALIWAGVRVVKRKTRAVELGPLEGADGA